MFKQCVNMILAATLVWLTPLTVCAQAKDKTALESPQIIFKSLKHDFGTAQPNERLTHSFIFTNQGTAALMIEKVKAG
jgi:hypothetical protein